MFYHAAYVTATRGQHILRVGTRWPFSLILHREQNRMPGIGGQNTNKASKLRGFQLRGSGRSCSAPVSQLIVSVVNQLCRLWAIALVSYWICQFVSKSLRNLASSCASPSVIHSDSRNANVANVI